MSWMPFRGLLLGWLAVICFAPVAWAEDAPPAVATEATEAPPRLNLKDLGIKGFGGGGSSDPATFSARFQVQEGSRRGTLSVTAIIDDGWHVYSLTQPGPGPMPSKVKVTEADQFKLLGPFQADRPPHIKPPDPKGFKVNSEEHEEGVTWTAPIEVAEGVDPATLEIAVAYSGQVCKDTCIPLNEKLTAKFAGYTPAPETPGEYHPDAKVAELTLIGHLEPAAVAPGGKAKLVITARPNPGWHVYAYEPKDSGGVAKPTLIAISPPAGWKKSAVAASAEPKVEKEARHHEEPVTWTMELTVPANAPPGEVILTGYIGLQTCKNQGGCLFPHAVQFRASLPVAGSEQAGQIPLEFTPLAAAATPRSIDGAARRSNRAGRRDELSRCGQPGRVGSGLDKRCEFCFVAAHRRLRAVRRPHSQFDAVRAAGDRPEGVVVRAARGPQPGQDFCSQLVVCAGLALCVRAARHGSGVRLAGVRRESGVGPAVHLHLVQGGDDRDRVRLRPQLFGRVGGADSRLCPIERSRASCSRKKGSAGRFSRACSPPCWPRPAAGRF